jgi:hypothetical protein
MLTKHNNSQLYCTLQHDPVHGIEIFVILDFTHHLLSQETNKIEEPDDG